MLMACLFGVLCVSACNEQVVVRETEATCGNGSIEAGEALYDGNELNPDGCTLACTVAACGDGTTRADLVAGDDGFEGCDDGNENDNDGCTNACSIALCGDGIVRGDVSEGELGFEACDDGNDIDSDRCLSNCQRARCGDGVIQNTYRPEEECDDGNEITTDACTNQCREAVCGDGILRTDLSQEDEGYEACDDGNTRNDDECPESCQPTCGNGVIDEGEDCDDRNEIPDNECNDCRLACPINTLLRFYNGDQVCFTAELMTWFDGQTLCQSVDKHLVYIESESANQWLVDSVRAHPIRYGGESLQWWTGARDDAPGLRWVSGHPMEYTNWGGGQPNPNAQPCVMLGDGGAWADVHCSYEASVICR